jgi:hypothetical protein
MNEIGIVEEWNDGTMGLHYSNIPLFHVDEMN